MEATDSRSLGDYLELLWRFKWFVAGVAVLAGAVAFWFSLVGPRGYESVVTFAAIQSKLGDSGSQSVANTAAFRPMVESLTTAAAVIHDVGLDQGPNPMRPSEFLDTISVTEIRGTNLLTVHVTMGDPTLSARIANSVADHAVQTARRVSASEVIYTRDLIKQQLDDARGRFELADAQLRDYRQQVRVEAVRKDAESRLGGPQTPAFSPKAQAGVPQVPVFVGDSASGRMGLLDVQVKIASEKAKLSVMERDLANRGRGAVNDSVYQGIDAAASLARSTVASLEQQKTELMENHKLDPGTMAVMDRLYAIESELARRQVERDVAEKVYVELAQRYQEARLQVIGKSGEFVIIDPAVPADRPVSRHVARNTVVVVAIWLCFAIAGVLMWDSIQKRRTTR